MPGFNEGGAHSARTRSWMRSCGCSRPSPTGQPGRRGRIVDLNFNLEPEGCVRVAKALEPFDLLWLEVDLFDPGALAHVRHVAPMPVCSGENLYGSRAFRPHLEAGGMDVASVDVIWNGFHQAKKIADLAETFEVNCAPHNYYSHLATFIAAQWCAAIPNARILEFDVDDVPWRDELVTALPEMSAGELRVPAGPVGRGAERRGARRAPLAGSVIRARSACALASGRPDGRVELHPEGRARSLALVDRRRRRAPCAPLGRLPVERARTLDAGSGHLGSTFSAMDIVAFLLFEELNTVDVGWSSPDRDVYFSSKGHDVPGLYSAPVALGVPSSERLMRLKLGGLDGHPDVGVPGIEANSGSLGMGISKGRGIAWAKRHLGRGGRVVVMVGDGELQEARTTRGCKLRLWRTSPG